ncbi:conserved hypothetical protein [Vibrio chagasii]|nr:conserved hypothetical protein [Vibrio chagasii]CAH6802132.1 conserved hypothetical protein [Vibrio chagasii]CAH6815191.1 conserved hypothetical protein [Vibrio chagasii]CAH6829902.1 conserved hypothetical protein [Vibrio chagasii]CAH6836394.1 conserved hypothetical protein [Vibrio chagasii]
MVNVSNSKRQKATFTPSLKNFKTSLGYEGMTINKKSNVQTIEDLKRKYAR